LALTKKTGYALVAMTHLARREGDVTSARELARWVGAPVPLLMNVLKALASSGFVESLRGARGGYRLARPLERINLADVVEAMEGPVRLAECMTAPDERHECTDERMARCPIHDPVHRVQRKLNDFLKKVTLADIVEPAP
jgi:Rrf2 family protein